jgi:hypothetical protein
VLANPVPVTTQPVKNNVEADKKKVFEEVKLLAQMFIRSVPYKDLNFLPEIGYCTVLITC